MIEFAYGNLLECKADALVNTVNCVGVMGKGIALEFKQRFPENFKLYAAACKNDRVRPGFMFVTRIPEAVAETGDLFAPIAPVHTGPKWIVNFPTKLDWRNQSQMAWIENGLNDLVRFIKENAVQSIAIPALGCSNGGLAWAEVRPRIETAMSAFPDVKVFLFPPQGN